MAATASPRDRLCSLRPIEIPRPKFSGMQFVQTQGRYGFYKSICKREAEKYGIVQQNPFGGARRPAIPDSWLLPPVVDQKDSNEQNEKHFAETVEKEGPATRIRRFHQRIQHLHHQNHRVSSIFEVDEPEMVPEPEPDYGASPPEPSKIFTNVKEGVKQTHKTSPKPNDVIKKHAKNDSNKCNNVPPAPPPPPPNFLKKTKANSEGNRALHQGQTSPISLAENSSGRDSGLDSDKEEGSTTTGTITESRNFANFKKDSPREHKKSSFFKPDQNTKASNAGTIGADPFARLSESLDLLEVDFSRMTTKPSNPEAGPVRKNGFARIFCNKKPQQKL